MNVKYFVRSGSSSSSARSNFTAETQIARVARTTTGNRQSWHGFPLACVFALLLMTDTFYRFSERQPCSQKVSRPRGSCINCRERSACQTRINPQPFVVKNWEERAWYPSSKSWQSWKARRDSEDSLLYEDLDKTMKWHCRGGELAARAPIFLIGRTIAPL